MSGGACGRGSVFSGVFLCSSVSFVNLDRFFQCHWCALWVSPRVSCLLRCLACHFPAPSGLVALRDLPDATRQEARKLGSCVLVVFTIFVM